MALGTDISGVRSLDRGWSVVTGNAALAEAILRRLTTPRGGLWYSLVYGFDLQSVIGSTLPMSVVNQRVQEQVLLEEEAADASVDSTLDARTGLLTVVISVVAAEGDFTLTIGIDEQHTVTAEALADGIIFFKQAA